jgi:hypothetical protein
MTKDQWEDAGYTQLGGEDKGIWVRSKDRSRFALCKPGPGQPPSTCALREYLASIIGHWIAVKVPRVELDVVGTRPVALSMKAAGTSVDWSQLMGGDDYVELRPTALSRLDGLATIIVLDALLGVGNRPAPPLSHGNHVYVVEESMWYSIDYADAFRPEFDLDYQPEFVERVLKAQAEISRLLCQVETIPDEALQCLLKIAPAEFATADDRKSMLRFILERRHTVRQIVLDWCQARAER